MADQTGTRAFIGLGSNLDNPQDQVTRALAALNQLPQSRLVEHSSLYRSDPVGPPGQPDYINAVAAIDTHLEPLALLDELQRIEQAHHRERKIHWGPRTLDLDVLLYGQDEIDCERLRVPHPFMAERNFVLYPLAEIAPKLELPDGTSLSDLLNRCAMGTLKRIRV